MSAARERRPREQGTRTRAAAAPSAAPGGVPAPARERAAVAALLVIHAGLVLWGAALNSVTFDENFHVPAGALIAARGNFWASVAQPPLAKTLCALPALALGARVPPDSIVTGGEPAVGEAFMHLNAARYHTFYFAARCVTLAFSLALALLVWRFARRLYGPRGALLALALYAFAPEALAHAGIAGVDVATGLGFTASIVAFWRFTRTTRWRDAGMVALAVGLTALTRFSAVGLAPIFMVLAALGTALGTLRRPGRVWLVIALLPLSTLVLFNLGYLLHTSLSPLQGWSFMSQRFTALAQAWPALRLPVPDAALRGLDYVAFLSEPGRTPSFLLGTPRSGSSWAYFPIALAVKWPLGFLGLILLRIAHRVRNGPGRKRAWHESFLLVSVAVTLGTAMMANLGVGVRYVFPILPLLCVWCGGLLAPRHPTPGRGRRPWLAMAAVALAAVQALEALTAAPWYLAFFNRLAGGPGGGYTIVNDSNVDWGQGLIALREEMRRLHIGKIHLAYHGTTDPAVYGIDYVPYLGGTPGPESRWLAVSSYYYVGLSQRMMTPSGRTERLTLDFGPLRRQKPDVVLAGCMYLFKVR